MIIEFKGDAFQHDQVWLYQDPEAGASEEYDLMHIHSKGIIRTMSAEQAKALIGIIKQAEERERKLLADAFALAMGA